MYSAKTLTATGIALAGLFAGSLVLASQADAHMNASESNQMIQGGMMEPGQNMPQAGHQQGMMQHGMGNMMKHGEMMSQMQAMMANCNHMITQHMQNDANDTQR